MEMLKEKLDEIKLKPIDLEKSERRRNENGIHSHNKRKYR